MLVFNEKLANFFYPVKQITLNPLTLTFWIASALRNEKPQRKAHRVSSRTAGSRAIWLS